MKGSLSPSALSTFKRCNRCFWLSKNKKISPPRGIVASLPNGMDSIIKDHHDRHRQKGLLPAEIAAQIPGAKPFADLVTLTQWRSLGRGIKMMVGAIPLMGLLDDLLPFEDGTHSPYDYKTRKSIPPEGYSQQYYQTQVDVYDLLLTANGLKTNGRAYFSYWTPKEVVVPTGESRINVATIDFDVTVVEIPTNPAAATELVKAAAACIDSPTEPASNPDCEYCAYADKRCIVS